MAGGPAVAEEPVRHRQGGEARGSSLPRDRPRPRGRGDLLACPGGARRTGGAQGRRREARGVPRGHRERGQRGAQPSARARPGAGGCLSRAPRARLPGRLHALAGAVAQAAGRPLRRPGAVGRAPPDLRTRGGDRDLQAAGILVDRGRVPDRAQGAGGGPADPSERHQAGALRHPRRGGGEGGAGRDRASRLRRRGGREEAGPAQPATALHHLDAAAGGLAQARLQRVPDDAHRPASVRRGRPRRRDRRPDHLYADRQHQPRQRGARGDAAPDRNRVRAVLRPRTSAPVPLARAQRARGA